MMMSSLTETFDIIAADGSRWIKDALCGSGDYDYDLWFPEPSERIKAAKAVRICRRCPVIRQCLQDSLERGEAKGIRGGLTPHKRTRMLRKRSS
jgi:WhiB family transcriptional regulator, redox-sensing transcriptional regulator